MQQITNSKGAGGKENSNGNDEDPVETRYRMGSRVISTTRLHTLLHFHL
jgi:hypothetical protein